MCARHSNWLSNHGMSQLKLTDLLAGSALPPFAQNPEIKGLTADSRLVEPGFLFAALPGVKADGSQFAEEARQRGATVILAPLGSDVKGADVWEVPNPRSTLSQLATAFYAPMPPHMMAVTGTNGKTSTAHFASQLVNACGRKAATIGTIGIFGPGIARDGSLTTPDPVALAKDLGELAGKGFSHVALEASSHGLSQHRLDGLKFDSAGFTYLGRDHLDYHGTLEDYFRAKAILFDELLPSGATAVLNADVPEYAPLLALCRSRGHKVISYGEHAQDLRLLEIATRTTGLNLRLNIFGFETELLLPITGHFQAGNALCALGMVIGAGIDPQKATAALPSLHNVCGRLELVGQTKNGAAVYVDYAHTPDALETILKALRVHTQGELSVVFGCGGNRDKGKRPIMGDIAARLADRVFVSDDNPRLEDAAIIRSEIMAASPGAIEIGDRAMAIQTAIKTLKPGDTLVLAGKGHEHGQIVGNEVLPFDDAAIARAALGEM